MNSSSGMIEGGWGFIDKTGTIIVNPTFTLVLSFDKGIALVQRGQLGDGAECGVINTKGNYIIPMQAEYVLMVHESGDIQAGTDKGGWGYMDRSGKWLIEPRYALLDDFSEGLASVTRWPLGPNSKFGYINKSGELVIGYQFDHAMRFSNGLASVNINGDYGYIDRSGKVVVMPQYKDAAAFSDGVARVKVDELWGFINTQGEIVVKPQYSDARDFSNGVAPVKAAE